MNKIDIYSDKMSDYKDQIDNFYGGYYEIY